ncbi:MAG TPA: protein kinase, partial [Terriglobales bacterium]|nr:protein kinase [Terriglobales bacterium]
MASEVGLKIDNRYEVLAELGRGGMGVVYKAMDTELERLVAIKVMTSHVADNPEYVSRFDAEARTAAKMQHQNIAVVYARGRHAGAPYIAMEFVEGTPLDKLINLGAQFSLLLKIDYIIQVCNALHYAHTEWKVVHRDVKPANIMVMKDGHRVKLLDFGIARAGLSTATKSGTAIGTTFYMSPQQIRGEKGLDGRSDVFSTGVVLYELITGNVPWTGESDFQVLAKIVNEPFPPLANYLQSYPPGLDRILGRALAKDLTSRYQTAEEMAVELAELQAPLKEEIIEEAYAARDGGDLLRANELASQVLRLDTRHGRALALHNELQPQLQKKHERLRELKEQAEAAVGKREFDRAISAISEAISINPTNAELQDLRKAIEQERERKKFVFNRLKLAQAAKEMSDLMAANKLIDEALEKDPTDTQARMMKTVLARMAEDEKKKKRLDAMAEEIRGFIGARRFSDAYNALRSMEELDANFSELAALKAQARDAYAREERRKELDGAIREVKKVLAEGNAQRALAASEQALQKFPEDSTLLKCREQAEALRVAAERHEGIKKEIAAAWELSGKKQSAEGVQLLEQAQQRYGADSQLRSAIEQLRGIAEKERVARAEQEVLEKARQAMHVEDFESAARILRAGRIDYPSSSEIKQALAVAEEGVRRIAEANKTRQREAIEILEALLASELHPEAQV